VLVGLEAQLDSAWIQRNFGFMSSDGPIRVFTPDRFRLSIALKLRAEL
jgi:hypothetical protein